MTSVAAQTAEFFDVPKLRLLPARPTKPSEPTGPSEPHSRWTAGDVADGAPTLRLVLQGEPEVRPVLVAGADSAERATMLDDLARTMPPSTIFAEADAFWEVLVRAPSSSMVILSGELDDVPAESLMQMLAQRHPGLPVVSVAASPPCSG